VQVIAGFLQLLLWVFLTRGVFPSFCEVLELNCCKFQTLKSLERWIFVTENHEPPHLHLTTSKVMVIVWRLRGNIIRTVFYIGNVLPLQWAQLTKTVHTARMGLEFDFLCFFRLHDLSLCWCMFCFTLDS